MAILLHCRKPELKPRHHCHLYHPSSTICMLPMREWVHETIPVCMMVEKDQLLMSKGTGHLICILSVSLASSSSSHRELLSESCWLTWGYPTPTESDKLSRLISSLQATIPNISSFLISNLGAALPLHISLSQSIGLLTAEKDAFLERITKSITSSNIRP